MKKNKSVIGQIEEAKDYKVLIPEKVAEIVNAVFVDFEKGEKDMVVYQDCKTKGSVIRTLANMNLCDDSTCVSCMEWKLAMTYGVDSIRTEEPEISMRIEDETKSIQYIRLQGIKLNSKGKH